MITDSCRLQKHFQHTRMIISIYWFPSSLTREINPAQIAGAVVKTPHFCYLNISFLRTNEPGNINKQITGLDLRNPILMFRVFGDVILKNRVSLWPI